MSCERQLRYGIETTTISLASHTLLREEGSGQAATIELSPWQKLAGTKDHIRCLGVPVTSCV